MGMLRASALWTLCMAGMTATELPLGDKDFYPSRDHPVGYRGDGNGYFPGATLVSEFWEGTPKQVERPPGTAWDFGDATSRNIAWKTKLPSWANSQPIVVGTRIFCTGEPDWLICCDARTGAVLWAERQNAWALAGVAKPTAATTHRLFDIAREAIPYFGEMLYSSTMTCVLPAERFTEIMRLFLDPILPRILTELKRIDPAGGWDDLAAKQVANLTEYAAMLAAGQVMPKHGGPDLDLLRSAIAKRIAALSGPNAPAIPFETPWYNLVGFAMSVPVSDGRHVFASFGQGQTVCYTLDGQRIWGAFFEQNGGKDSSHCTEHIQSPLLAGEVLIDMHGGIKKLRGLAAATGTVLWEAPTKCTGGRGGGYYIGSHAIMHLRDEGQAGTIEPVVVTTLGNIIRVRDGKILGFYAYDTLGASGGPSIAYSADVMYRACFWDGGSGPLNAFRLSLSGESVRAEKIWEGPGPKNGYQGRVALPGYFLISPSVYESTSGTRTEVRGYGGVSDLVVGSTWIWSEDNSHNANASDWGFRRWDGKALAIFHAAEVSRPASPHATNGLMIIGDADFPNVPAMQELAQELYALPTYGYHAWGKPMHSVHADNCFFAQGDRLYIRTVSSLYCIADPARPYHAPAGTPVEGRTPSR